jgi:predicted glycoside hydrolase/deacetylase ChbG (UPF0249 family)
MESLRKILIVNADDFGRSSGVNRGVAIAHQDGIVTSTSLMVRRPAAAEAAAYARQHAELSVGLHVDLGEWVYRNGEWEAVEEVPGPVEDEVHRQLATFELLMGREPTHLDSHQHVHRQDAVGTTFTDLARQLAIPLRGRDDRVRYCGDFYGQTAKGEPLPEVISVEALLNLVAGLPNGVTELGCHPGVGMEQDEPYGSERSIEVATLCDGRIRAAINSRGIELRSFAEVYGNRSHDRRT